MTDHPFDWDEYAAQRADFQRFEPYGPYWRQILTDPAYGAVIDELVAAMEDE